MTEIIPATRGIVACPVERSIVEADITAMVGKYPTQTILRYEDPGTVIFAQESDWRDENQAEHSTEDRHPYDKAGP